VTAVTNARPLTTLKSRLRDRPLWIGTANSCDRACQQPLKAVMVQLRLSKTFPVLELPRLKQHSSAAAFANMTIPFLSFNLCAGNLR
jgi:hypothetical protein